MLSDLRLLLSAVAVVSRRFSTSRAPDVPHGGMRAPRARDRDHARALLPPPVPTTTLGRASPVAGTRGRSVPGVRVVQAAALPPGQQDPGRPVPRPPGRDPRGPRRMPRRLRHCDGTGVLCESAGCRCSRAPAAACAAGMCCRRARHCRTLPGAPADSPRAGGGAAGPRSGDVHPARSGRLSHPLDHHIQPPTLGCTNDLGHVL
jgi:hypothetical protein